MPHSFRRRWVKRAKHVWYHTRRIAYRSIGRNFVLMTAARPYLNPKSEEVQTLRQQLRDRVKSVVSRDPDVISQRSPIEAKIDSLRENIAILQGELARIRPGTELWRKKDEQKNEYTLNLVNLEKHLALATGSFQNVVLERFAQQEAGKYALDLLGITPYVSKQLRIRIEVSNTILKIYPFHRLYSIKDKAVLAQHRIASLKLLVPILGAIKARQFYKKYNILFTNFMRD